MAHDGLGPSISGRPSTDRSATYDFRRALPRTSLGGAGKARRASTSFDYQNEASPLIIPQRLEDDVWRSSTALLTPLDDLENEEIEETKSVWYLLLLTIPMGGLQISWSVELSNFSPYLLSLGLSKSLLALVWIAGPLSGTLVQPYVGIKSDACRVSWGKRKPFMIVGGIATIVSLLAVAWAKEIVHGFLGRFGINPEAKGVKTATIIFAVLFVYILDFAINTVQAGIRAYIVDNAPTHQQEDANAWASRISGVGNILGYLSGYVDLPAILPIFGNTEFKVLCMVAVLSLGGTLAISCSLIKERDPRTEAPPTEAVGGVTAFLGRVFTSFNRLPPKIRKVCEVQFFAWIGWFPFLFYITTYVGEIYVEPYFAANPHMTPDEIDTLWEQAVRLGTFSLLIFAVTSFLSNVLLPFIVAPSYKPRPSRSLSASAVSILSLASLGSQKTSRINRWVNKLVIPWLTLRRAWFLSHILFAICMWLTLIVRTTVAATALVGLVGVAWALTNWAPFALISAEISKRDAIHRGQLRDPDAIIDDRCEDQAGIVLGLHNVAIAAPQIIATLGSSAIFRLLQKPRGSVGDDSVGWVLRIGGVAALIAAYMTIRVDEERKRHDDDEERDL
ncbi:MAG: hypothetical protein M1835_006439 [Candelina submexicana]|nr:MAG: hypothetical protein M1835_006439 [Candelina submexicana]